MGRRNKEINKRASQLSIKNSLDFRRNQNFREPAAEFMLTK